MVDLAGSEKYDVHDDLNPHIVKSSSKSKIPPPSFYP